MPKEILYNITGKPISIGEHNNSVTFAIGRNELDGFDIKRNREKIQWLVRIGELSYTKPITKPIPSKPAEKTVTSERVISIDDNIMSEETQSEIPAPTKPKQKIVFGKKSK